MKTSSHFVSSCGGTEVYGGHDSSYLRDLKRACLSDPGNSQFWEALRSKGSKMGLIGSSEAKRLGGTSDVSDAEAEVVSPSGLTIPCCTFSQLGPAVSRSIASAMSFIILFQVSVYILQRFRGRCLRPWTYCIFMCVSYHAFLGLSGKLLGVDSNALWLASSTQT